MFFANARGVEDRINAEATARPELEHVLLQCSAVNDMDASAFDQLASHSSATKRGFANRPIGATHSKHRMLTQFNLPIVLHHLLVMIKQGLTAK